MTIEITRPEVELLITQRLESGAFTDAEDVILQALRAAPEVAVSRSAAITTREVFERIRGLADDVDFSRNPSTGRPVDL